MEGHHNVTGFSCSKCLRPDSADEQMVACDVCQQWEHFTCAGVDGAIKDHPYLCCTCKKKKATGKAKETLKPSEKQDKRSSRVLSKKEGAPLSTTSFAARMVMLAAQMKLLEEQELQEKQDLVAEEELKKRKMEKAQRQLEENRKLLEEENRLRDLNLQEEKDILEKRKFMRQQSIEKKNELLKQMSDCGSRSSSNIDSNEKVSSWLAKQDQLQSSDPPMLTTASTLMPLRRPISTTSAPIPELLSVAVPNPVLPSVMPNPLLSTVDSKQIRGATAVHSAICNTKAPVYPATTMQIPTQQILQSSNSTTGGAAASPRL